MTDAAKLALSGFALLGSLPCGGRLVRTPHGVAVTYTPSQYAHLLAVLPVRKVGWKRRR